ncbi:hypothetical protein NDU88_002580 [Pleurodeles waltl]|uniref:Uncharacterized protein n=1 Tax=Pleurodeles waltl TaxID=8319 RepID=A0AAV7SC23_PLEWA|nr:hypothetical protein NDU88_002580 [Pleurodeles waltl]
MMMRRVAESRSASHETQGRREVGRALRSQRVPALVRAVDTTILATKEASLRLEVRALPRPRDCRGARAAGQN